MKKIKEYLANYKEQNRLQEEAKVKAEFRVQERGGFLWLTHNGVAFMMITSLSKAEDVTKELSKARECAVEFERL